jgi:hypothetical protein
VAAAAALIYLHPQPLAFFFKPAVGGENLRVDLAAELDRAAFVGSDLSFQVVTSVGDSRGVKPLFHDLRLPEPGFAGKVRRTPAIRPTKEQRIRLTSPAALLTTPTAWGTAGRGCGGLWTAVDLLENATVACIETLNLLLFAYVVRCLLEFRLDGRESWLFKASLVYGAAMANNWAMIGFFPLFLAALIWMKGLSFLMAIFGTNVFHGGRRSVLYLLLPQSTL